jgi:predicted thioesterase
MSSHFLRSAHDDAFTATVKKVLVRVHELEHSRAVCERAVVQIVVEKIRLVRRALKFELDAEKDVVKLDESNHKSSRFLRERVRAALISRKLS